MQTETKQRRIPKAAGASIAQRKTEFKYNNRSKGASKTALSSGFNLGADILNHHFQNIISDYSRDRIFSEHDVNAAESCNYLKDSAVNYLKLMGVEFKALLTGNKYMDIILIYNELKSALPEGQRLNIDANRPGKLSFVIYGECDFPSVFVFTPIKAVLKMDMPLSEIFLEFIKFYSSSQGILDGSDHGDLDYILTEYIPNELECWEDEGRDDDDRRNFEKYLEGFIPELFKKIEYIHTDHETILNKCLEVRSSLNGDDLLLIDAIIEGIPLLESDSIMSYSYPENSDDDEIYDSDGVSAVEFDRTFGILWDTNDWFCGCLEEWINNDINEFGCQTATTYKYISPDTEELFKVSEYPVKFYDWYCKLYEILEKYELNN